MPDVVLWGQGMLMISGGAAGYICCQGQTDVLMISGGQTDTVFATGCVFYSSHTAYLLRLFANSPCGLKHATAVAASVFVLTKASQCRLKSVSGCPLL